MNAIKISNTSTLLFQGLENETVTFSKPWKN